MFKIIILIIILIILKKNKNTSKETLSFKYIKKKYIFTFWEPKTNIPGYLRLCIRTWKKFLSDYEIIILDYETVKEYLGKEIYSQIIYKNMPIAVQSDAIRIALLNKYGGIWIDTDTIILNNKLLKKSKDYELIMIREGNTKYHFIGFIYALKNSTILKKWLKQIIKRVKIYKYIYTNKTNTNISVYHYKSYKSLKYLGNKIINKLLKNATGNQFFSLNNREINALPERTLYNNPLKLSDSQRYKEFYFKKRNPEIILNNSKEIILLHNSWTPLEYKIMSENEFLMQDILISKLLKKILNINT